MQNYLGKTFEPGETSEAGVLSKDTISPTVAYDIGRMAAFLVSACKLKDDQGEDHPMRRLVRFAWDECSVCSDNFVHAFTDVAPTWGRDAKEIGDSLFGEAMDGIKNLLKADNRDNLTLPCAVFVRRIELSMQKFKSDFDRGVRQEVATFLAENPKILLAHTWIEKI